MKTQNRFHEWQEKIQSEREKLIKEYIDFLKTTKVKIKNLTNLAELVARQVSIKEGKPCNKSTLLRNIRYKSILLNHQYQTSSGLININKKNASSEQLNKLVSLKEVEIVNLKNEIKRLKTYISYSKIEHDRLIENKNDLSYIDESTLHLTRTLQGMLSIINYFQEIIEIDMNQKSINDKSKRFNNRIIEGELCEYFIAWYARNYSK